VNERTASGLAVGGERTVEEARVERNGVDQRAVVQMGIPAEARYLRLARLTCASLGADLGLTMDGIEDLRVAVDELCAAAIEDAPPGATIQLEFQVSPDHLVLEGSVVGTWDGDFALHPVAGALLDIVAGDYSIDQADGRRTFRLLTRSPSDDADC